METKSAHVDSFARDNLPPREQWPEFRFTLPALQYPARLNCVAEFLDRHVAEGHGGRPCLIAPGVEWSYAELLDRVDRIAQVLVRDAGLVPGDRVLLRSANNPMMVASYLAALKAGAVVVATMPLLRAKELAFMIEKARVRLAICDSRLLADLETARAQAPVLRHILTFGGGTEADLEARMDTVPAGFAPVDTAAEDICLIGFTSGTTGVPKGTMHNHRDLLAICDAYSRQVLRPNESDRFIGSPPLAFTFGLGGLVLFPMRAGASTVLLERASPAELLDGIERFRPTISFTAPTAYRAMLAQRPGRDLSSLRRCVSAGEALPAATYEAWRDATGIEITEGIGATEMLHIFIASSPGAVRPGSTGTVVPGYEAKIVDDDFNELPAGEAGRLAVRGPTGCRYLADDRQLAYVRDGWNLTGDTYRCDADGYFWYQARSDDMIVSAGYNIAGPEVENALMTHPAVQECGVVGVPDPDRGQIVKAYVVLKPGQAPDAATRKALQDHVKAEIAPYKYPRAVEFLERLPRTETGKLQRFQLRRMATEASAASAKAS
ncbi:benzoate-CoA ligase family protein [Inquilinus limosus]|uniref:2-aminobenzoate-CoA ligase n=1 Tax=Inquilinus limosus TaxID=171674 RepID=A0A211ZN36_9PROT|nr:benzoate-CoA ligase family protein [Inquilinus limosus]OWJ66517.1 2-aminobenzoate-CoA ligase [Inquilinus limosus]